MKRERFSATASSVRVGRWEMSMCYLFRFSASAIWRRRNPPPPGGLRSAALPATGEDGSLRVELDDQLLLERHVDLRALGELVDEDPQGRGDDLQPRRDGTLAEHLRGDLEPVHLGGPGTHVDDVVLRHPVARDGHLLVVDPEVPVAHELSCLPTRLREGHAVHDVVETRFQALEEILTGLARAAVGLLVVAADLLLHDAGGEAGLLLLLQLGAVLGLLDPRTAVVAGREGPTFECGVPTHEVDAEAPRLAGGGAGVTCHSSLRSFRLRLDAAWADGSRCGAGA